ncbi:hypothetical protein EMIT0180MI3_30147 [Priestia megaterium]
MRNFITYVNYVVKLRVLKKFDNSKGELVYTSSFFQMFF